MASSPDPGISSPDPIQAKVVPPRAVASSGKSSRNRRLRILLVDDHPLMRTAIVGLLEAEFGKLDAECVGTASQARSKIEEGAWDLVLLDHQLPDGKGVDVLPLLSAAAPVVVLTTFEDKALAGQARENGASGFATKGDSPEGIVAVVRSVLQGKPSYPILERKGAAPDFSPQERKVLQGLLTGIGMAEIAASIGVTSSTAQSYKARLFRKVGVETVAELVRKAVGSGWI